MRMCALMLLVAVSGCATTTASKPVATTPSATVVKNGDAKVGDTTVCPVSGETFIVEADSPKVSYGGKTYFFCCHDCEGDFQKDPARYLSAQAAP